MIKLSVGDITLVEGFGRIKCVEDRARRAGCEVCCFKSLAECKIFECRSAFRPDGASVHFERVKGDLHYD